MKNLNQLLKILLKAEIEFVLIGGYAGVVHGSTQLTQDLDICAAITEQDIEKLREALKDYHPKHRMNPSFKPSFFEDPKPGEAEKLNAIYLETDLGVLDILKSVTAVGDFEVVNNNAVVVELYGMKCKVISLDHLIQAKEKMGRDKDKVVLKDLYEMKNRSQD